MENIKGGAADSRAPHAREPRPAPPLPLFCPHGRPAGRCTARGRRPAAALAPAGGGLPAAWLGGTEARAPGVRGAGQGAGRRGGARLGAAAVGVARWRRSRAGQGKARRRAGRGG